MAKSRFKFDCFKKGHKPMKDGPTETLILAGYPHAGYVCGACKVPFFVQLSDKKVSDSGLVTAEGKIVI